MPEGVPSGGGVPRSAKRTEREGLEKQSPRVPSSANLRHSSERRLGGSKQDIFRPSQLLPDTDIKRKRASKNLSEKNPGLQTGSEI